MSYGAAINISERPNKTKHSFDIQRVEKSIQNHGENGVQERRQSPGKNTTTLKYTKIVVYQLRFFTFTVISYRFSISRLSSLLHRAHTIYLHFHLISPSASMVFSFLSTNIYIGLYRANSK